MDIKTEFNFILPKGLDQLADSGKKTTGTMRLLRVKDIIDVYKDTRVKQQPAYFYVILLSRVIRRLGTAHIVNAKIIENLYPDDFAFLIDFLNEINHKVLTLLPVECSNCGNRYFGEVTLVGEL